MEPTVIVALISAGSAIIVGLITYAGVRASNDKAQAVLEEKVSELTREVRQHNNFAQKIPLLEQRIEIIEDDIKEIKDSLKS